MRHGVRLGVDVGSVRIGVARSDPRGVLATPVETVRRGKGDLDRIAAIAAEHEAIEVVVGLPTSLSGREGRAAELAREFATRLAVRLAPTPGAAVRRAADHGHRPAGPAGQRGAGQEAARASWTRRRRWCCCRPRSTPSVPPAGRRAGPSTHPRRARRASGPEESRAAGPSGEPKIAGVIYNRTGARTSLRLGTTTLTPRAQDAQDVGEGHHHEVTCAIPT